LQRVTFKQTVQVPLRGLSVFGVQESEIEYTVSNLSANALASGVVEITTSGMLRPDVSNIGPVGYDWLVKIAAALFERFGNGNQRFSADLIRGAGATDADTANLGDEYLVNVKQIPNHNKRYGDDSSVGARALQICHITELVDRRQVVMWDSGPNA